MWYQRQPGRMLMLTLLFSLSTVGCGQSPAPTSAQASTADIQSAATSAPAATLAPAATAAPATVVASDAGQASQAVVQRFYDEVFNAHNLAATADIFDANFAVHDLDVGGELPGGDLPGTLAAFPDVKATINQWVVQGDLVTAIVTLTGTHQDTFIGVAPTGRAVTWSIIDVWRVKDGKITDLWHNIPNDDILEQIGAAPAAAPATATP
jgi:predicted SnoaL-like aldol condensation-catalyzing enzyme